MRRSILWNEALELALFCFLGGTSGFFPNTGLWSISKESSNRLTMHGMSSVIQIVTVIYSMATQKQT